MTKIFILLLLIAGQLFSNSNLIKMKISNKDDFAQVKCLIAVPYNISHITIKNNDKTIYDFATNFHIKIKPTFTFNTNIIVEKDVINVIIADDKENQYEQKYLIGENTVYPMVMTSIQTTKRIKNKSSAWYKSTISEALKELYNSDKVIEGKIKIISPDFVGEYLIPITIQSELEFDSIAVFKVEDDYQNKFKSRNPLIGIYSISSNMRIDYSLRIKAGMGTVSIIVVGRAKDGKLYQVQKIVKSANACEV